MRACLASMVECNIDDIPPIEEMDNSVWFKEFHKWLDSVGLEYEGMKDKPTFSELCEYSGVDGYVMVGGKSPRPYINAKHSILMYQGIKVHDPHPSNAGILSIDFMYFIKRGE
jgi:hypothetical protein